MKVPAFDLKEQFAELREELLPALEEVLSRGEFILGDNVRRLEAEVAAYTGTAFGIGVANGSDALNLALMACGIGPGDEVIVPAFTFFATAGAVARTGATPVFVDVDSETYNIDVQAVENAVTPRTRAVIPVHLYGQIARMEELTALARRHGLAVIEDAAQAIGATRGGKPIGCYGNAACLSFYPTKNLGAYGDAGMIITNDPEFADQVRVLRVHGSKQRYYHHTLGYNSRLDEIQASILRTKLRHLDAWTKVRREVALRYDKLLSGEGLVGQITIAKAETEGLHVYHQYTVRAKQRNELQEFLRSRGVGSTVYYPLPLHLQPVFENLGYRPGSLPNAEQLCQEVLSLPMYPELSVEQQEYVVEQIAEFYRGKAAVE